MNTPKISVLIPTYNYARYLDQAIQSVLNQTFTDFELIIVDDNSSDNTNTVMQKYLADKRISYYKNPTNLGLPGNWNKCLSLAKGKYLKFLMADDKFHPQLLEKFTAIFDRYPNVSVVTSNKALIDTRDAITERYNQPYQFLHQGEKIIYESLKTMNFIGEPTTVMIRRENMRLGNFNTEYCWIPDWDMWLRHLSIGDCYIIPEVLSYFRQHTEQATVYLNKKLHNLFEEYTFFKKIQKTNPYNIDLSKIDIAKILKFKSYRYFRSSTKGLIKGYNGSWFSFKDAFKKFMQERLIYAQAACILFELPFTI
jgi:glycosyltransferase involved in cell wall biosynthesis